MSREAQISPVTVSLAEEWLPDNLQLQIDLRLQVVEFPGLEPALPDSPVATKLCAVAFEIYSARRKRDRMFDDELFGEPAWDMMLALYCLPQRGEKLGVTALSYAANVPLPTGHRVQAALFARGLIEREREASDARRQLVRLSDKGRAQLEKYLASLMCSEHCPQYLGVARDC